MPLRQAFIFTLLSQNWKPISPPLHTDLSFYQSITSNACVCSVCVCLCVCLWVCVHVHLCVCGCMHLCVCMSLCVCVCVCVCDEMRVSLYLCKCSELLRDRHQKLLLLLIFTTVCTKLCWQVHSPTFPPPPIHTHHPCKSQTTPFSLSPPLTFLVVASVLGHRRE